MNVLLMALPFLSLFSVKNLTKDGTKYEIFIFLAIFTLTVFFVYLYIFNHLKFSFLESFCRFLDEKLHISYPAG